MKRFATVFISFAVVFFLEMAAVRSGAAILFQNLPDGCPQMTSQALTDLVRSNRFVFYDVHSITGLRAIGPFRDYIVRRQSVLTGDLSNLAPYAASPQNLPERASKEICHDYLSYMVLCGTNMAETLTVGLDPRNHWETFGAVMATGKPDPMWIAYQEAKELPQVKKQDYEFRYLMVDLDMRAVWLHGKTDDIIIPFPLGYKTSWNGYQPYSIDELARVLRGQPVK